LRGIEFVGELGLTGELRAIDGVLPAAVASAEAKRKLIVPADNGPEAALVRDAEVVVARTLLEVCSELTGAKRLPRAEHIEARNFAGPDLEDVRGQAHARRALEIAAAGQHHVLFVGTPGCGKTLLASRLSSLLPEQSEAEALESASVASVSGRGFDASAWRMRPFRAPHHSASSVALAGGGPDPRPGEISLAHNGVLFLDELPEWKRDALQVLREPLESGVVTIARAARRSEYPARFQLVAAMNPCPCGWAGDSSGRCRCTPPQIDGYLARISGPLLDRIDLHVEVPRLPPSALRDEAPRGEGSATVRARVVAARERQLARAGRANAHLDVALTASTCRLERDDQRLLERAIDTLQLSARSMHRILRVARTIADLAGEEHIATAHLTEAIGYRRLDRRT
jgi:magnesium chelatase family protein